MNLGAICELQANRRLDGRLLYQGLPISVENRKGSVRKGRCEKGKPHTCWKTKMTAHYGYLKGVDGVDGDSLDCFIGPDPNAATAYIVVTKKVPDFEQDDEHKVMLGYNSAKAAKAALIENYGGDARHFGSMTAMPMERFKERVLHPKFQPQKLTASKLEQAIEVEKVRANIGEPGVYEGGMGHLQPIPSFRPPSLKKSKPVPTDDPMEKDNKFLDVTKRKSKATKKFRDERTRRVAVNPNSNLPGGSTAVQHHTAMNLPFVTTQ